LKVLGKLHQDELRSKVQQEMGHILVNFFFREPRNDANMRETFESPLRRLTTPLDRDQLSPSERVKIALERLRWKNINKQLSQEITEQRARPSSSETDGEKTSQYSFGLFERDRPTLPLAPLRKSQSTVNRKKPRSETASQYLKVPDLDGSKLPSVMQHFCEPSNRSARRKQSSNYVTEWLNKSSVGSKEKRQPPLVRNEVSDSDDFLNEWLKAAGHANSVYLLYQPVHLLRFHFERQLTAIISNNYLLSLHHNERSCSQRKGVEHEHTKTVWRREIY
jgi:hypothetical protein